MADTGAKKKSRTSELSAQRAERRLDVRIGQLLEEGHTRAVTAKRLGITEKRVETALESIHKFHD
jgi:hypothetical protein